MHPAVDQDRRLPGGLRLLLAIGARQDRAQGREIDGRRRGAGRGGGGQGAWLAALLHGRGVARAQGPRHGQGLRDGRGREGDGARNLHDARHADRRAGAGSSRTPASIITTTISTPRPNIMARSSRRGPSRSGSTRWRKCASAGIAVCCGGIVGMGESRDDRVGFIHALATLPRHPESVPINALVPVKGTVLGDMFGGRADDRRHRVRPHRRGGADHHAALDGPPVGRPREHERSRPRRCASSPAPTASSPATSCSPPPTPATAPTRRCSPSWA